MLKMLTEYFGSSRAAQKLMRHFASVTIEFPSAAVLSELAIESQVAESVARDPSCANVARLASLHDLSNRQFNRLVKRSNGIGIREQRRQLEEGMHCRHPNLGRLARRIRV